MTSQTTKKENDTTSENNSTNCIFCILSKKKENILYENESVFVVANISPLSLGHLLVIPKEHAELLHELSDESLSSVLPLIKKIVNVLGYKKYNVLQNNKHIQSVMHVHFHIIPYVNDDECLKIQWTVKKMEQQYFNDDVNEIKEKLEKIK